MLKMVMEKCTGLMEVFTEEIGTRVYKTALE
jgi:hypothetical protein